MASNTNRKRDPRLEVTGLVAHFKNGQYVNLDTTKVAIVDKQSGKPVFDEVLDGEPLKVEASQPKQANEGIPTAHTEQVPFDLTTEPADQSPHNYVVEFDTPEGRMEYVKNGVYSGVRRV
jgi:hypothetical protein